ncbi:MAG: YceI family protein [Gemmatimonadaceae bacterium]
MTRILLIVSALIAASSAVSAQSPSAIRLRLEPGSVLSISGTSSMHDFACKTDKMAVYVDVDPDYTKDLTKVSRPIVSVHVTIPVKNLKCGKGAMDDNMYKTLKADKEPVIKYTLSGYDILDGTASPAGFAARTKGTLTVAGQQKDVDMQVIALRLDAGKASAEGEQTVLMTDFGIKPPSFMLGTLKVGNEIKVKFNIKVGPEMLAQIAALGRP